MGTETKAEVEDNAGCRAEEHLGSQGGIGIVADDLPGGVDGDGLSPEARRIRRGSRVAESRDLSLGGADEALRDVAWEVVVAGDVSRGVDAERDGRYATGHVEGGDLAGFGAHESVACS